MAPRNGVSVIVCTNRPDCIRALFANYGRQTYKHKELIVILNDRSMELSEYRDAAKPFRNVRVYRIPGRTLGFCLNFGVRVSRFGYVAKFDDDDYYGADYLSDSLRTLHRTNADIVGKRAHYMFLSGASRLLLRYGSRENRYVPLVQGATLLVKRGVFRKVAFRDRTGGECVKFCSDSRAKGFTVYSGSRFHFAAIRRPSSRNHTWVVSYKRLLTRNAKVLKVRNFRSFVCKPS